MNHDVRQCQRTIPEFIDVSNRKGSRRLDSQYNRALRNRPAAQLGQGLRCDRAPPREHLVARLHEGRAHRRRRAIRSAGTRTRGQRICRERPRRGAGEGLRGGGGDRPSPSRNATRAGPRTLPAPAPCVRAPLRRICRDQARHRHPGRSGRSVLPRARPTGRPRPASARSGGVSVRGAKKATCSPPSRRGAVHLAAPRRTGLRRPVLPRHRSLFPPRPPRSHLHRSTCRRGRVMASRGGVRRRTNIG